MPDPRHPLRRLAELRSPWFYWYRGRRLVALAGLGLGLTATGLYALLTAGIGVIPLVFVLTLDHLLLVFILLYVLLRWSAPTWLPLGWADWYMLEQVLLIAAPGILLTRFCTLAAARFADSRAALRGQAVADAPVSERGAEGRNAGRLSRS